MVLNLSVVYELDGDQGGLGKTHHHGRHIRPGVLSGIYILRECCRIGPAIHGSSCGVAGLRYRATFPPSSLIRVPVCSDAVLVRTSRWDTAAMGEGLSANHGGKAPGLQSLRFAGGMPFKGQLRIVALHAAAVIGHPYVGYAAVYLNGYGRGSSVDGVFQNSFTTDEGRSITCRLLSGWFSSRIIMLPIKPPPRGRSLRFTLVSAGGCRAC